MLLGDFLDFWKSQKVAVIRQKVKGLINLNTTTPHVCQRLSLNFAPKSKCDIQYWWRTFKINQFSSKQCCIIHFHWRFQKALNVIPTMFCVRKILINQKLHFSKTCMLSKLHLFQSSQAAQNKISYNLPARLWLFARWVVPLSLLLHRRWLHNKNKEKRIFKRRS